jgi:Rod binding domain-containing protein
MLYVNPQSQATFRASALAPGSAGREEAALKQFEQLFLFQMLQEMRKTIPDYGVLGGGSQKAYFEEMMDDFLAGEMADSGQFGVAKQMASQLHAREKQPDTTATAGTGGIEWQPKGLELESILPGLPVRQGGGEGLPIEKKIPGIPLARAHSAYAVNR